MPARLAVMMTGVGGRRPRLRDPAWVSGGLAVLAATAAALVWEVWDADTAAGVVGVASLAAAVATIWLAWVESTSSPSDLGLGAVADQLADTVFNQWDAELEIRQVHDPLPLPVAWDSADASLTDDWASIRRRATLGTWPPQPPGHPWAANPAQLAGRDDDITDVLGRIPTGRLVILGEPRAGKTVLAVRLLLGLRKRRASGGPVPVLLPLASWDPATRELGTWLEGQLVLEHPGLAAAAPDAVGRGRTRAKALLEARLVLPILDGLDELPPVTWAAASRTRRRRGFPHRDRLAGTTESCRAASVPRRAGRACGTGRLAPE